MTKFKLYFDKDKEIKWLNEMAEKGQAMTGYTGGFYKFEPCEPGEYIYQVDLNAGLWSVSKEYREFMEEMGIEIVALWGFWVILRKKAAEGKFQLYTDVESKIESYTKIRNMFKIAAIIEFVCFVMEMIGVMEGAKMAILFMLIIGIFLVTTIRMAFKTNQMILELKEENIEERKEEDKKVTNLMVAGLFLNTCTAMIPETVNPVIKDTLQIAAIIIMLFGLYWVAVNQKRNKG